MDETPAPPPETHIVVNGIVAMRDKQPYVQLAFNGQVVTQLSIAAVRKVAADMLQMAARTEADAMIHRFFSTEGYPVGAAEALMVAFRDFRRGLDEEPVEAFHSNPETGDRL